jgi:hypothetical protein
MLLLETTFSVPILWRTHYRLAHRPIRWLESGGNEGDYGAMLGGDGSTRGTLQALPSAE